MMAIGVNRLAGELVPFFFGLGLLASNLGAFRLQLSKHRVIVKRCKEIGGVARARPSGMHVSH